MECLCLSNLDSPHHQQQQLEPFPEQAILIISMARSSTSTTQLWVVGGLATVASLSLIVWYLKQIESQPEPSSNNPKKKKAAADKSKSLITPRSSQPPMISEEEQTPLVGNRGKGKPRDSNDNDEEDERVKQQEKALHARIEELDKKGKALFKNKMVRGRSKTSKQETTHTFIWLAHSLEAG